MKFTIDRKTWLRGKHPSKLLNGKGMSCCLGQVCLQQGIESKDILNIRVIPGLSSNCRAKLPPDFANDLTLIGPAYNINDRKDIEDAEREKLLQEHVKKYGHEFVFIN